MSVRSPSVIGSVVPTRCELESEKKLPRSGDCGEPAVGLKGSVYSDGMSMDRRVMEAMTG